MNRFKRLPAGRASAAVLAGVIFSGPAFAAETFEQPLTVSASEVLPAALVAGPNHRVRDEVRNDGFLNIYTIDSKYGPIKAVSTVTLRKRIGELDAMAGMETVRGSEEFRKGMREKAGDFVEGGAALVRNPIGAVSGAASGVASVFRSVSRTLDYGKSDTEGSRMSAIVGFDKTRREYAAEFQVDAYSRNEYLQQELRELSRAGFLGTSVVRLGTAAVSGPAGAALTTTGNVEALNDLLNQKSAGDLRVLNEGRLRDMGVEEDLVELFMQNRAYTMTQQTTLVYALDRMAKTANRAAFVRFAALTDDVDMAAFRQRQAQMYAAYHGSVAPVASFEMHGPVAFAPRDRCI